MHQIVSVYQTFPEELKWSLVVRQWTHHFPGKSKQAPSLISPFISGHITSRQSQRFCFCSDDPVMIPALLIHASVPKGPRHYQLSFLWRSKGERPPFLCIPESHKGKTGVQTQPFVLQSEEEGAWWRLQTFKLGVWTPTLRYLSLFNDECLSMRLERLQLPAEDFVNVSEANKQDIFLFWIIEIKGFYRSDQTLLKPHSSINRNVEINQFVL